LYDRDPAEEGAQLIERVGDVNEYLAAVSGVSSLGTGGMLTKLQAANMAQNSGCTTYIANGEVERPLSSIVRGERRCTICVAHERPMSGWRAWLADRLQMAGALVLHDDAAARLDGKEPICREDIATLDGDFSRGDVLHIYDASGKELARGLSDFSAEETRVLVNNPDLPAHQLLGYQTDAELIRPNNLVLIDARHIPWDAPDTTLVA
jgi:glutamate 5-kinase